jgi:predicted metal-dependent hydrolase
VQLDLPFLRVPPVERILDTALQKGALERPDRGEPAVGAAPDSPTVEFVRMRRAKRYVLRVRADGSVRVTVPRGGSRAEAVRFLDKHTEWIQRERSRVRASNGPSQWTHGSTLLLDGVRVPIRVDEDGGVRRVCCGARVIRIPAGAVDLRPCIEADLRALAREELPPRLVAFAAVHGLTVAGVSIRNQKSRWGSCSPSGRIALNFRLVQMPRAVSDYVLLHELMHLQQQNHSRRFWRLVEAACPGFREAERWLKTEGRTLF